MSKRALAITVAAVAAVSLIIAFSLGDGDSSTPAAPQQGTPAPAVSLAYFDGTEGTLADLRGTPVILNLWASWCPACVAEMPGFQAVHEQLGDRVTIIGLDVQDTREASLALVERTGVSYALADDPDGAMLQTFGIVGLPTTVFINAEGNVVDTFSGFLSEELLNERIQTLLLSS